MPGLPKWEVSLQEAMAVLASDHRSGAAELVISALDRWLQLLQEISTDDLPEATRRWAEGLVMAQPCMAPFFHLAARLVEEGTKVLWDRESFIKRSRYLREDFRALPHRVADAAVTLLLNAKAIVTYSRSSTVLLALEKTAQRGHFPKVILSEGRPMLEGVDAARQAIRLGLSVRLTVDAALSVQVSGADLVVVGGDSLGPRGLVNKVGTSTLVAAACEAGVPVYALCSSDKWLPSAWEARLCIREHDPREILAAPPDGLEISNLYFDRTPLDWLTAVVTERGISTPQEVLEQLEQLARILDS